jgi:mono/diheme cytochrome c family protein
MNERGKNENGVRRDAAPPTFAVLGLFDTPDRLIEAIPRVGAKGLGKLEAYSPYPIHGLEKALGLRRSPLGGMVLVMGILGVIVALFLEGWTSAVDYPIVTGGKAPFSWEAFVPVMFEVMVLFATFTAGLGMLILLNRLPFFRHPVLASRSMAAITRDKFALSVESDGSVIDEDAARAALEEAGAATVEVVPALEPLEPVSSLFLVRSLWAIAVSCLVAGLATYWAVKLFPVLPPMAHMLEQPRVDPFEESSFFRSRASMQLPVPGTIARGHLPYLAKTPEEAGSLPNPLPRTAETMLRGKKVYADRCTVCHGSKGDGKPTLTSAYGAAPANLLSQTFLDSPDGQIYHAIVVGKNSMPGYAADIPEDDRWAVVHYVRALQRAQSATDADVEEAIKR